MKFTIYKCDGCGKEVALDQAVQDRWSELFEIRDIAKVMHFCSHGCRQGIRDEAVILSGSKRQFWEIYRVKPPRTMTSPASYQEFSIRWTIPSVKTFDILSWPEGEERND